MFASLSELRIENTTCLTCLVFLSLTGGGLECGELVGILLINLDDIRLYNLPYFDGESWLFFVHGGGGVVSLFLGLVLTPT